MIRLILKGTAMDSNWTALVLKVRERAVRKAVLEIRVCILAKWGKINISETTALPSSAIAEPAAVTARGGLAP